MKAIDIFKEAIKIFAKNSNFIFFAAIASLPLFFFSLYFENRLQDFLFQASEFHNEAKKNEKPRFTQEAGDFIIQFYQESDPINLSLPLDLVRKLTDDLFREFLHLGFLYLVPFNLLQLASVIAVVDSASKLYREEKALTFNDMLGVRLNMKRFQGVFVTFLFVVFLSTCSLIGFMWLLITYSSVLTYFSSPYNPYSGMFGFSSFHVDMSFHVIYGSNWILLTGIYLAWSCIWNLGLVISVLEEKYVAKAFGSSAYLCLRNVKSGMVLMALFSLWELGLRVLGFLSFESDKRWALVATQSGLFCFGNAVKWVVFVVYFEGCVKKLFTKKVDVEEGES